MILRQDSVIHLKNNGLDVACLPVEELGCDLFSGSHGKAGHCLALGLSPSAALAQAEGLVGSPLSAVFSSCCVSASKDWILYSSLLASPMTV